MHIRILILYILLLNNISFAANEAGFSIDEETKLATLAGYPLIVYLDGKITTDTPDKFKNFIEENKIKKATIYLNSPGGNLLAGIKLGKIIRKYKFYTSIGKQNSSTKEYDDSGQCLSACVHILAGGSYRFMDETDKLGIHRFSRKEKKKSDLQTTQYISGILIVEHLREMDVDTILFEKMSNVENGDLAYISKSDAEKINLINNGFSKTKWLFKNLDDGTNYFKAYRESMYNCNPP